MIAKRSLIASAALSAMIMAGCGGGGSPSTLSANTGASGSGASGAATTVAGGAASGASGSAGGATTTTPDFKGSGSGDLCSYAKDIESSKTLDNAFSSQSTPSSLKDGFNKALGVINTAVGKAPSEIKADMQTLAKGFQAISDFYSQYDWDVTKLAAAAQKDPSLMQKMTTTLDSADYQAATTRVDAYFQKVCGITTTTK